MPFLKFFLGRMLAILCLLVLTFLLVHVAPGGPFDGERKLPPEIRENLELKYGLQARGDHAFLPWISGHFKTYLTHLSRASLGPSLKHRDRDVGDIIAAALPVSILLGALAGLLSIFLSVLIALGVIYSQKMIVQKIYDSISRALLSAPLFLTCVLGIMLGAIQLKLFPAGLWESWRHIVLPVFCLAVYPTIYLTDLLCARLRDLEGEAYITAARARGLSAWQILTKHRLKVAMVPVIAVLGPMLAQMVTGSFVVETVFGLPGLGRHFVNGVMDRDLFLVQGITLVLAVILILCNDIADYLRKIIDPRSA